MKINNCPINKNKYIFSYIYFLFLPSSAFALSLAQEPPLPTSKSAYVAPNVILSIDDSGSMAFCLSTESESNCPTIIDNTKRHQEEFYWCKDGATLRNGNRCYYEKGWGDKKHWEEDSTKLVIDNRYQCSDNFTLNSQTENCEKLENATDITAPIDGVWPLNSRRINVLKHSLKEVFNDLTLIPENKIRIAWQSMNNTSKSPGASSVNSSKMNVNSMRPIDDEIVEVTTIPRKCTGYGKNQTCTPETTTTTTSIHRDNFIEFVDDLKASGGTPSHRMLKQADDYMRRSLSENGPWSTSPGNTSSSKRNEYLGCRRNYHILLSDGRWTEYDHDKDSVGNTDGTNLAESGDRKAYNTTSDQTRIYRDTTENTLADIAFKSWAEPLQTASSLKDSENLNPPKTYSDADDEEFFESTRGGIKKSVNLNKYWNPKYNPATWPHMVTYTIGFSDQATTWDGTIAAPTEKTPFGYDNGFIDLLTGWESWPSMRGNNNNETGSTNTTYGPVRSLDLWHAAINGRGRFYAVNQADDLAKAFTEIIGKINEENAELPDQIAGGGSTSGYNVSQNNAGIFASVYSPKDRWSGYIKATRAIEPIEYDCKDEDGADQKCIRFPDVVSGWQNKTTAQRLDEITDLNERAIATWSDETGGIPFKWSSVSTAYTDAQKRALVGRSGTSALTPEQETAENELAEDIINYIRGDRSLEGKTPTSMRERFSRHGDIVNSEIWYTGSPISNYAQGYSSFVNTHKNRTPVLYVGANDGMLHGFSAKNGKEVLAYVPRGVVKNLRRLTDPDYEHLYYVDGSPMTGDIKNGNKWQTLLTGTLGAGGKGYFLLDVTNPDAFSQAAVRSNDTSSSGDADLDTESESAAKLVIMDRTRANNEALGDCSSFSNSEYDACVKKSAEDADIGNITSHPGRNPANLQEATQITRLNNGRWAVVMGNGYNSTNQRPVLLIQYLDTDSNGKRELLRIQTTTDVTGEIYDNRSNNANDNGLASPALVDLDGDGTTDIVYAGDNLGNLWKFDLTSPTASDWAVAFGINKPLFTARGPASMTSTTRDQVQPISAAPIVRANDRQMLEGTGNNAKLVPMGGLMVAFGTGRNVTNGDRRIDVTQNVQTLYSVLDNTRYKKRAGDSGKLMVHLGQTCSSGTTAPCTPVPVPAPVGTMGTHGVKLAKQSISVVNGDFATVDATEELTASNWSAHKGWYLDLPATGERLLKPMQFYDGSNILAVYTETPPGVKNSESENINESCVPVAVDTSAGSQYRTLINIMDGKRPTIQIVDYNKDVYYNHLDLNVARSGVKTGTPILLTKRDRIEDATGGGGDRDLLARMPESPVRPSWRQMK